MAVELEKKIIRACIAGGFCRVEKKTKAERHAVVARGNDAKMAAAMGLSLRRETRVDLVRWSGEEESGSFIAVVKELGEIRMEG